MSEIEVVVFGPNLSSLAQRRGEMHVHAAGCADCCHYGPGRKFGGDVTAEKELHLSAGSLDEVVKAVYPPGEFEYDPADWEQFEPYVRSVYVFPCVRGAWGG